MLSTQNGVSFLVCLLTCSLAGIRSQGFEAVDGVTDNWRETGRFPGLATRSFFQRQPANTIRQSQGHSPNPQTIFRRIEFTSNPTNGLLSRRQFSTSQQSGSGFDFSRLLQDLLNSRRNELSQRQASPRQSSPTQNFFNRPEQSSFRQMSFERPTGTITRTFRTFSSRQPYRRQIIRRQFVQPINRDVFSDPRVQIGSGPITIPQREIIIPPRDLTVQIGDVFPPINDPTNIIDTTGANGGSLTQPPGTYEPPPTPGSMGPPERFGLTSAYVQKILDKHNAARRELGASDMLHMHWDDQLAIEANDWIKECKFEHLQGGRGENLAMAYGHGVGIDYVVNSGLDGWYNEKKMWKYGDGFSAATGHYTQMIWAGTRNVGCAARSCPRQMLFFCFYSPPGNIMGRDPFQFGAPCSQCPGSQCRQGLCD